MPDIDELHSQLLKVAILLFSPLPAVIFDRFDPFDLCGAMPVVVGRYFIHLKIIPHCCGIKLREERLAVEAKDRCVIRMNYSVLSTRADDAACIAGTAGRTAFS